tara:strand:+ start:214 stop:747 length:534 start_codon:yes stop_codon:yes gene_type:complete
VLSKKNLKVLLHFTENQHPAPSFILIYILTWLTWHNQLISAFLSADGSFLQKTNIAFASITENQYLVVFFISCLILFTRLGYNYLRFKSRELLNESDQDYVNARDDQVFEKNADITQLMSTLTSVQEQLTKSKEREKKAIAETNEVIKKMLNLQQTLDEAHADIQILNQKITAGDSA